MDTPAVRIDGLSKAFGKTKALDDVSFDVPTHSIFGLLGPNGAGKTTLMSVVSNFLRADRGQVEVLGMDIRQVSALRGRWSIFPQDAAFQRNVPIFEQLVFFGRLNGKDRAGAEEEVHQTLKNVGLTEYERRGVRALSHGMVKRLGIAQAFLGSPEVIMLDEPTAGLDPQNARTIRELIRNLKAQATIVISSHNLAEIQDLCDQVAILDKGKLVLSGTVDEITQSGREYDLRLSRDLTDEELGRLRALATVAGFEAKGPARYIVTLDMSGTAADLDESLAEFLKLLLELRAIPRSLTEAVSLEEQFIRVTGQDEK